MYQRFLPNRFWFIAASWAVLAVLINEFTQSFFGTPWISCTIGYFLAGIYAGLEQGGVFAAVSAFLGVYLLVVWFTGGISGIVQEVVSLYWMYLPLGLAGYIIQGVPACSV